MKERRERGKERERETARERRRKRDERESEKDKEDKRERERKDERESYRGGRERGSNGGWGGVRGGEQVLMTRFAPSRARASADVVLSSGSPALTAAATRPLRGPRSQRRLCLKPPPLSFKASASAAS